MAMSGTNGVEFAKDSSCTGERFKNAFSRRSYFSDIISQNQAVRFDNSVQHLGSFVWETGHFMQHGGEQRKEVDNKNITEENSVLFQLDIFFTFSNPIESRILEGPAGGARGRRGQLQEQRARPAAPQGSPGAAHEMLQVSVLCVCAAAWCGPALALPAAAGRPDGGNFLDDRQWLTTVSQYDQGAGQWNKFRDMPCC
ncbi:Testican-3 [Manis javanica]|nr:Testican-3 [Manis javanica]